VSRSAALGETLRVLGKDGAPPPGRFQWYRVRGAGPAGPITGAVRSQYSPEPADVGCTLLCSEGGRGADKENASANSPARRALAVFGPVVAARGGAHDGSRRGTQSILIWKPELLDASGCERAVSWGPKGLEDEVEMLFRAGGATATVVLAQVNGVVQTTKRIATLRIRCDGLQITGVEDSPLEAHWSSSMQVSVLRIAACQVGPFLSPIGFSYGYGVRHCRQWARLSETLSLWHFSFWKARRHQLHGVLPCPIPTPSHVAGLVVAATRALA
jgi:Ig domain of plant-specific actin-binding protein